MIRLALTGGIAAGKSAASQCFRDLGVPVIDHDRIARDVVGPGRPALREIIEEFGAGILRPDGSLDRQALAAIVFADPGQRIRLEAITHPRIAEEAVREDLQARVAGEAVVVHDIPLLFEGPNPTRFDKTIVVDAPHGVRLRRLIEDRGMTREQAEARMSAQISDEERRSRADVMLDGSGTVEHLCEQVRTFLNDLGTTG